VTPECAKGLLKDLERLFCLYDLEPLGPQSGDALPGDDPLGFSDVLLSDRKPGFVGHHTARAYALRCTLIRQRSRSGTSYSFMARSIACSASRAVTEKARRSARLRSRKTAQRGWSVRHNMVRQ
jgi:hypothetical protein